MPDKPEVLTVNITKVSGDQMKCIADRAFVARRKSTVTFRFDEVPDADIIFSNGSPFEKNQFKPGSHRVRDDAATTKFDYDVKWAGGAGQGNGSGEVPPAP